MKDFKIQIVEESNKESSNNSTNFRFVIALAPKKDSLEIRLWEKRYGMTDMELLQAADNKLIERIRMDAAIEVFSKFYQDNFINP